MHIVIFGASGKVGRLVLESLLAKNYVVTAFVHGNGLGLSHPNLTLVQGDVHDTSDVEQVVRGKDVVISTLGSWHTPKKDILSAAMKNIVPAMKKSNVSRIITLTGVDAFLPKEKTSSLRRFTHKLFSMLAPQIVRDSEIHLATLQSSDLAWTSIRSPGMRSFGPSKTYKLSANPPYSWQTVHRLDVATAVVDQIKNKDFLQSAPFINKR